MPGATKTTPPQTDLTSLRTGDVVEVYQRHGRLCYYGEIDTVDPTHGVLWLLHGALKERKLIEASEYQIYRRPPTAPEMSSPAGSADPPPPRETAVMAPRPMAP